MNEILRDARARLAAARDDARPDGRQGGDADLHLPEPVRLPDRRGGGQPRLPRGGRRDVLRRLARAARASSSSSSSPASPRCRCCARRTSSARSSAARCSTGSATRCSPTPTRRPCCTTASPSELAPATATARELRLDLPFAEKGDVSLKKIGLELVVRVGGAQAHDRAAGRDGGLPARRRRRSPTARWWSRFDGRACDAVTARVDDLRGHIDAAHAAADRLVREAQAARASAPTRRSASAATCRARLDVRPSRPRRAPELAGDRAGLLELAARRDPGRALRTSSPRRCASCCSRVRALIDWYLDRLERAAAPAAPVDGRGHPDLVTTGPVRRLSSDAAAVAGMRRGRRCRLPCSCPWYRASRSSERAQRGRERQPDRVRRVLLRRGGGAAGRGRRPLPALRPLAGQGLPPAGRRRLGDHHRRRLGGRSCSSGGCSTSRTPTRRAHVGVQWGIFVAIGAAVALVAAGQRLRAAHRPSRPTRPRTRLGVARAPARRRAPTAARSTRPRSRRCSASAPPGTASRPRPRASPAPTTRTPTRRRATASSERRTASFSLRLNNSRSRAAAAGRSARSSGMRTLLATRHARRPCRPRTRPDRRRTSAAHGVDRPSSGLGAVARWRRGASRTPRRTPAARRPASRAPGRRASSRRARSRRWCGGARRPSRASRPPARTGDRGHRLARSDRRAAAACGSRCARRHRRPVRAGGADPHAAPAAQRHAGRRRPRRRRARLGRGPRRCARTACTWRCGAPATASARRAGSRRAGSAAWPPRSASAATCSSPGTRAACCARASAALAARLRRDRHDPLQARLLAELAPVATPSGRAVLAWSAQFASEGGDRGAGVRAGGDRPGERRRASAVRSCSSVIPPASTTDSAARRRGGRLDGPAVVAVRRRATRRMRSAQSRSTSRATGGRAGLSGVVQVSGDREVAASPTSPRAPAGGSCAVWDGGVDDPASVVRAAIAEGPAAAFGAARGRLPRRPGRRASATPRSSVQTPAVALSNRPGGTAHATRRPTSEHQRRQQAVARKTIAIPMATVACDL